MEKNEIYNPPWRAENKPSFNSQGESGVSKKIKKLLPYFIVFIFLVLSSMAVIFARTYIHNRNLEKQLAQIDDTTPYAVKFTEIGSESFTIEWKTKTPTIGFIKYGLDDSSMDLIGQGEKNSGESKTYHKVIVDGLDPGERYYVEIHSNAKVYGEEGLPLRVRTLD